MPFIPVKPESPMPSFMRGIRQLYGWNSLRKLATQADLHASALSRAERGLVAPSMEMLWKWSEGVSRKPNPDLWVLGIYAGAATWPEMFPYLLVRYTDTAHNPKDCWQLAERTTQIQKSVFATESLNISPSLYDYEQKGKVWYPHFNSTYRDCDDAVKSAWFSIFCRSDPVIFHQTLQQLPEQDPLSLMPTQPLRDLWTWLVQNVWIADSRSLSITPQSPQCLRDNVTGLTNITDPNTEYINQHWTQLTSYQKQIILMLIKSWE